MRRLPAILLSLLVVSLLATPTPTGARRYKSPPAPTDTTLDRTIVGQGTRTLKYGPGRKRVTRRMGWKNPVRRPLRPLAAFKHISDVHVIDEESPARVEFLDECGTPFTSAYRPQEAMSLQIGNSMLKQLANITHGPATYKRLRFVVSTGDNIDNNQLNEQRAFMRLLDGRMVDPNSGGKGYHGYTREHFAGAPSDEVLKLAQRPFKAVGTKIPWYGVLGNHDGLVQGNSPSNPTFEAFATGGLKPFTSIDGTSDCPDDPEDAGAIEDAITNSVNTNGEPVPADEARSFLSHEELVGEFFKSSTKPKGHGLAKAPNDPVHGGRAGYYTFNVGRRIKGISLDTTSYDGVSNGHVPDPQFQWLERKLMRWSKRYYEGDELKKNPKGRNKMIMIFSHHSSPTLNNPGANPAGAPYHCFTETDQPECADGEGLKTLLQRFPNVIAWVNGHEHNNRVAGFPAPEGQDPARGFWELNTAAHIDWPQQSRLIEVAWKAGKRRKKPDTVYIFGTTVDHIAPLRPNKKKQNRTTFLASFGRVESYVDACIRQQQAKCEAPGTKRDANVRLLQKAPFNLGR